MMLVTKNSLLLLCVWALVLLSGAADAATNDWSDSSARDASSSASSRQGGDIRGVVKGVVDAVKNAVTNAEATAEKVFSYDFNKDGQIGKFRSQEDDMIDTRQVAGDPKAAGRFQMSRPRTGRMLETEGAKAAPAPRLRK